MDTVSTYKGRIVNGLVKLTGEIVLAEKTEVFVVVPVKKPKFDLAKMASKMPKDYLTQEVDFGSPVGKEVW